ncbi:DKNYY domain-containing protein [Aquimarina sp. SS2-1]|uniref:DKNYY domain-containing protein n=1 Tax=Aquimarina besae TaxID=3342247 RepID=UPI00366AEEF8
MYKIKVNDIEKGYSISGENNHFYNDQLPYKIGDIEPIKESYCKIGNAVYFGYLNKLHADVSSFEIVHPLVSTLAKDKDHAYFKDQILEGANPKTFQFLDVCLAPNRAYYLNCDIDFYAEGDRFAYFVGAPFRTKTIKTKDIDNFRFEVVDERGYTFDNKYRYERGIKKN